MPHKSQRGFTLIELLVVIAIIGILSSVVLASLNTARAKSRDVRRRLDLNQMAKALEVYYSDNGSYPVTSWAINGGWKGMCAAYNNGCNGGGVGSCTITGANGYIPNLAPTYMNQLPRDPNEGNPSTSNCYQYKSNGTDYKILDWQQVETIVPVLTTDSMYDPAGRSETFSVYTPGGSSW